MLKTITFVMLFLLIGCSSKPKYHSRMPYENNNRAYINEDLSKDLSIHDSLEFDNNISKYHAYFGIGGEDCKNSSGQTGLYIVELFKNNLKGFEVGDQIISIGSHSPKNSKELTYILRRLTPDTAFIVNIIRNSNPISFIVAPKPRIIKNYHKRFETPRKNSLCSKIGLEPIN